MAINQNRPVISYENIALFQSDVPAYSSQSNGTTSIEFLPMVQGIDVSVDFQRNNAGQIGSKDFTNQSFQNAPDVNLTINTFEDFGNLFSCLFTGNIIREDLDLDRNFYAVLGERRSFDVVEEDINGNQVLSFGNCFLQSVSMNQTIGGVIQSSYNFVGSNLQAQTLTYNAQFQVYQGDAPAIDLDGNQAQSIDFSIRSLDNYYSTNDYVVPYYDTNVLISGNGSFGNFLINSESIQSFDLNLPINRKTIYSLGKKYPVKRKALFPSEGSFSFTNKTENFYVGGDRANLNDFLSYDEFYTIFISGKNQKDRDFICKMESGKLNSMNLSNSIGSNTENSLSFSFEINRFNVFLSNALVFTVDTSKAISTSNTEFTVGTSLLFTYNCTVDWGDGSTDEINTYDDPKWSHTYSSAGVYQIKISGKFGGFYSLNSLSFREKLISIDNWGNTEIENFYYAFSSCRQLVSVDDVIPVNSATSFNSCFNLCTSLTTIPSGLFDNCTLATDFTGCFRSCSSLTTIPSGLFDNCTLVTSFYLCFQGCTSLTTIPSGLFDNCTLVTNFSGCFQNCNSPLLTTIPSGLFDNCTLVINFASCFNNCTGLNSIPSGLFDNCTLVSNFASCFYNCNGINSIPSGLFDNCTLVIDFSGCFANCNLLTAIPSGLFDNCTAATTFSTCFLGCLLLETIPSGLFSNCAAANNFARCFYACVSLKTIPNNIFPPSANNFSDCFSFVALNTTDYSNLLIYLESTNSNNNVAFHGGNSKYNTSAATARSNLQTDHNWSITDGGAA
jgi:hypothetical protein